jgi:hypothetical protein
VLGLCLALTLEQNHGDGSHSPLYSVVMALSFDNLRPVK